MKTFDDVTRVLAAGVSRREALKLLASATLAAMLSPWEAAAALAAPDANVCRGIPGSSCGVESCPNSPDFCMCYCFPVENNLNRTKCGLNEYCYSAIPCNSTTDCVNHFGNNRYFCSITCCGSQMVCVHKCPKICRLGVKPGGGLTAAG